MGLPNQSLQSNKPMIYYKFFNIYLLLALLIWLNPDRESKIIVKKSKVEGLTLFDFIKYYKVTIIKTSGIGIQIEINEAVSGAQI